MAGRLQLKYGLNLEQVLDQPGLGGKDKLNKRPGIVVLLVVSAGENQVRQLWAHGKPRLHNEFLASLGYSMRDYLKQAIAAYARGEMLRNKSNEKTRSQSSHTMTHSRAPLLLCFKGSWMKTDPHSTLNSQHSQASQLTEEIWPKDQAMLNSRSGWSDCFKTPKENDFNQNSVS